MLDVNFHITVDFGIWVWEFIFAYSFLSWLCFSLKHICSSGQENAANVSLEVLKALPRLQQRDQSRGGRFGDGGRGGGNRFGRGGGGRNGRFSNDRFSNGGGRGGRGNWGGKRWWVFTLHCLVALLHGCHVEMKYLMLARLRRIQVKMDSMWPPINTLYVLLFCYWFLFLYFLFFFDGEA